MFDLITIGDATLDTFFIIDKRTAKCSLKKKEALLCMKFAEKICLTDSQNSVGGNAANVAVGTTKLGIRTAILTELGNDLNGNIVLNDLKKCKVNTSLVSQRKNAQTRFSVVLNYKSERTILSYYVKRNYKFPKLPQTKWVYYTSMGEGFEQFQPKLIKYLKRHPHIKVAMNPGSYQMKHIKTFTPALKMVDVLFVNKEEAQAIAGKKPIPALMQALYRLGPKKVIITDSTNGSYTSDRTACYFMKPYPIKPIARTGAGDAYASGVLSALIKGKDLQTAMKWGTANAGGVIQVVGAHQGLLREKTITSLIQKHKKTIPKIIKRNPFT